MFIVDKAQNLSEDKDFVLAMDRLIQFAQHMRLRERLAQVPLSSCCALLCVAAVVVMVL